MEDEMRNLFLGLVLIASTSYAEESLKDILIETAVNESARILSGGDCPKIGFDFDGAVKNIIDSSYGKNYNDDFEGAFSLWINALEVSSNEKLILKRNTNYRTFSPVIDIYDDVGEKKFELVFGSFKCKKF